MIPPIVIHCGIGILTVALAIPLVMRKVPMNRWYGVRLPKAFRSDRNWYDINCYGGKLLLAFGLLLTLFGIVSHDYAPSPESVWSPVFIVGPLLLLFPLLVLINMYARRLPD